MNLECSHIQHSHIEHSHIEHSTEVTDSKKHEFGFGEGGVPWFLLLGYLALLVFFSWYVVDYPLQEFEEHSHFPISAEADSTGVDTDSAPSERAMMAAVREPLPSSPVALSPAAGGS